MVPAGPLAAPAGAEDAGPVVEVCDIAHLNAAVEAAPQNSTIRFACDGTITMSSRDDMVFITGNENGPRSLGIDGAGHHVTIDGNHLTQLLFLAPMNTLRLANLTFANGANSSPQGPGAIDNLGNLTVRNVLFHNNAAAQSGGAIRNFGNGSLNVVNSAFVDNQAFCAFAGAGGGGAIEQNSTGPLTVTNSVFRHNSAIGIGLGGAIYAHADTLGVWGNGTPKGVKMGPVAISGSVFIENVSKPNLDFDDFSLQGGGAIWAIGVDVTIDGSRFINNQADFSGGAIRFLGSIGNPPELGPRSLIVKNSLFQQNTTFDWLFPPPYGSVPSSGGAISAGSFYPPDKPTNVDRVTISDSRFEANLATFGSAIVTSERLNLIRSTLVGNESRADGGGALFVRDQAAAVRLSSFIDNVGGGCTTLKGRIVDRGGNLEQPGNTCGFGSGV